MIRNRRGRVTLAGETQNPRIACRMGRILTSAEENVMGGLILGRTYSRAGRHSCPRNCLGILCIWNIVFLCTSLFAGDCLLEPVPRLDVEYVNRRQRGLYCVNFIAKGTYKKHIPGSNTVPLSPALYPPSIDTMSFSRKAAGQRHQILGCFGLSAMPVCSPCMPKRRTASEGATQSRMADNSSIVFVGVCTVH